MGVSLETVRAIRLCCGISLILCWPDKPELRLNLVSARHFSSAIRLGNSDCDAVWIGNGLHWTWGKLLAASHRSHPCSPQLPKPCHANPIQTGNLGEIQASYYNSWIAFEICSL